MNYNPRTIKSIINFGTYKGQSIIDIWQGQHEKESESIIKNYLLERYNWNSVFKTPCSDADLSDCMSDIEILNDQNLCMQIDVIKDYIVITTETTRANISKIKKLLKTFLNGSYKRMTKTVAYPANVKLNELTFSDNSSKFIALSGNPKYLMWCIENLAKFFMYPDDLEALKKKEVKVFEKFAVTELEYDLLKFQPIFNSYQAQVSNKIVDINFEKFNKYQLRNASLNTDYYDDEFDPSTNWSHYNDDLEMDEQSLEFWNQF